MTPPVPSAQDIRLAVDPETTHLIVGMAEPEPALAAWRFRDDVAQQIHFVG